MAGFGPGADDPVSADRVCPVRRRGGRSHPAQGALPHGGDDLFPAERADADRDGAPGRDVQDSAGIHGAGGAAAGRRAGEPVSAAAGQTGDAGRAEQVDALPAEVARVLAADPRAARSTPGAVQGGSAAADAVPAGAGAGLSRSGRLVAGVRRAADLRRGLRAAPVETVTPGLAA